MINEICPLCHSKDYKILYNLLAPKAHRRLGLPGIVKKCKKCNLIFKSFDKSAATLYEHDYALSFIANDSYSGSKALEFFEKIVKKTFLNLKVANPKLLDIGSGVGIMLESAKKVGFQCFGVELSKELAAEAQKKGFVIFNKNVSDISLENTYDVITMMDIIEHLEDPKDVLMTIKNLLNQGGELIVYTPNHDSFVVKIAHLFYYLGLKSPVENIFACTHTCFFTTKTLKSLIIECGYKIEEVKNFNYDTSRAGQKVSFIAKLALIIIEGIGNILGYGGFRLVIYAGPKQ